MSISRQMDEKAVVHIHNGKYSIKKNTFESVLMRWMKLESIIQSEVSQKEKHQYSMLTHICVCVYIYIYIYIWDLERW